MCIEEKSQERNCIASLKTPCNIGNKDNANDKYYPLKNPYLSYYVCSINLIMQYMKQFSSNVGELKNQYLFLFFITRQWHLIGRHHDMVLPWDSGLIPRGMSQGFVLNMAPVQTHQGLQPECKK